MPGQIASKKPPTAQRLANTRIVLHGQAPLRCVQANHPPSYSEAQTQESEKTVKKQ